MYAIHLEGIVKHGLCCLFGRLVTPDAGCILGESRKVVISSVHVCMENVAVEESQYMPNFKLKI